LAAFSWTSGLAEQDTPTSASGLKGFLEQDYLLGDWAGNRTRLKENGVEFEFVYFGAVPSNVDGGLKEGSVYEGALLMTLDLYSEKLVGYDGGQLHAGGLSIHNGREFSANYVGDLNKVSLLDFPDTLHLWELWYEQKLMDGRIGLKFGQLAIDRDFIVPEYYNSLAGIAFLNQTFFYPTLAFNVYDQPYFPPGDHALASTPYGTPGARVWFDVWPERVYFQVGAYDGNPDRSRGGVRVNLNENEGALIYAETGLRINQTKEAQGPPGNLKIGGYYHTDDFVDMYQGGFAAMDNVILSLGGPPLGLFPSPQAHSGNYGVYLLADQMLWREIGKEDPAQQGLVGFFRVAAAPEDRNLASFEIDGGVAYKGLIPRRDWDTFGIGLSYLKISDDLRSAQRDLNAIFAGLGAPAPFSKLADYEGVLELSYKAQLTAWWTLQTSVERVFHPGGRVLTEIPDAWAVVVQMGLRL
jgi:porin